MCLMAKKGKMKSKALQIGLFSSLIIFSTASQCCDDSFPEGRRICNNGETPAWIDGVISTIQESGYKGEIIQYQYKGKTAFWINRCLNCTDHARYDWCPTPSRHSQNDSQFYTRLIIVNNVTLIDLFLNESINPI